MTSHRLTVLAVCCFVSVICAAAMRIPSARAEAIDTAEAGTTQGRGGYRGAPPPRPDPRTAAPQPDAAGASTDITGLYFTHFRCRNKDYDGKLALFTSDDAVLTAFMTIVNPSGSAERTTTFKLAGRVARPRSFFVRAVPTTPPTGVLFGALQDTTGWSDGKILASMGGCGDTMVATRDATESAKITSIATAEQVAHAALPDPVAVHAAADAKIVAQNQRAMQEMHPGPVVPSPPPSPTGNRPASFSNAGLVRKSAKYWSGFRGDLIREIFDGGFGADVDETTPFKVLFTSYVEAYSKSCKASLPASRTAITITSVTARVDRFGNVINQNASSSITVEADPRFAPKYREFAAALSSSALALRILTSGQRVDTLFDPALDVDQFFQDQKCQGPGMHQLTENLLRGAHGKSSLQQAGETIAGAAAETDPSTPPGSTHFSDACYAYYRDSAHPEHYSRNATRWCSCLSDHYRNRMTTADEASFARDFNHFLNLAAGPKPSTGDVTIWERFHAGADACRQ